MGEAPQLTRTLASDFMEVSTGENDVYFISWFPLLYSPEQFVPWLSALAIVMTLLLVVLELSQGIPLFPTLQSSSHISVQPIDCRINGNWCGEGNFFLHSHWEMKETLSFIYNPWYSLCVIGLTLLVAWALLRILEEEVDLTNMQVGGLVPWTLLTGLISMILPGVSYLFQWPVLFALAGALISSGSMAGPDPGGHHSPAFFRSSLHHGSNMPGFWPLLGRWHSSNGRLLRVLKARDARIADLRVLAEQIQRESVTIEANASEEGHLYGSVGAPEIATALRQEPAG